MKISSLHNEITQYRNNGGKKLYPTGSWQLDQKLRLCKGFPLFIGGHPYSGKSEVVMELLMKWSIEYGWKHYLYLGEGGTIPEIVSDLCHKYVGKPFDKNNVYSMSDAEYNTSLAFIDEHFYFADPNKAITYKQFSLDVAECERRYNVRFDTTVIDPFNDLDYNFSEYPNITYWLKDELKNVRKNAELNDRIDITIVHTSDVQPVKDNDTGQFYIPPALPTQWEGGKIWFRRAFNMWNIYRNQHGQTEIRINKIKPKYCKINDGDESVVIPTWSWDFKKNRYSERVNGLEREILQPSANVRKKSDFIESDELPF